MDLSLFKEFLLADMTQRDFAALKGMPSATLAGRCIKAMKHLIKTKIIDGKAIVKDLSMITYDVRENRYNWLKAIEAYERAVAAPVNYEVDNRKIGELTVSEFSGLLRHLMIR